MSPKSFLALTASLSIAAVVGALAWHTLQQGDPALAGAVPEAGAATDAGSLRAENEQLRRRIRELEAADRNLPERGAAPELAPERPVEEPPPPPPPAAAAAFAFDDPRFAEVLAKVDWKLMGEVTREMQPLLLQLLQAVAETGEVPTALAVQIQQLNSKLVAQVPAMLESGAPGFGPNGSYTHPLFVANTLASTLAAGGHALAPAQQAAIAGLVRSFSVENEAIVAGPRDFELEHLLAEAELKDRFFAEVTTRLTPEQQAQLYPAGVEGYDGANLFGTGVMTRPYTQAIPARDPAEFARLASNRLGEQLGLDEATGQAVRGIVETMSRQATDLWEQPADATEQKLRMLRTGRTQKALRHQIAVLREIQRQVPLSAEQRDKLRKLQFVLVPLPR